MCCLEGARIYSLWIVMVCPTESPLAWWQAWLILPAEKSAEKRWVKKASPYCCPLLKSSLNSENCQECLFKEATLGAEDKSIYLHVRTTQCLCWTPNMPVTRSLGWRCWGATSPGGAVYPTETWHTSNQLHGASVFPPSPASVVSSEKICSPGH